MSVKETRCKACGWENTDQAQMKLIATLTEQGYEPEIPSAYQILGPKPEHTCKATKPPPLGDQLAAAAIRALAATYEQAETGEVSAITPQRFYDRAVAATLALVGDEP